MDIDGLCNFFLSVGAAENRYTGMQIGTLSVLSVSRQQRRRTVWQFLAILSAPAPSRGSDLRQDNPNHLSIVRMTSHHLSSGSIGLQRLLQEPQKLSDEIEKINTELESLIIENYKVFVENLTCSIQLQTEVSTVVCLEFLFLSLSPIFVRRRSSSKSRRKSRPLSRTCKAYVSRSRSVFKLMSNSINGIERLCSTICSCWSCWKYRSSWSLARGTDSSMKR